MRRKSGIPTVWPTRRAAGEWEMSIATSLDWLWLAFILVSGFLAKKFVALAECRWWPSGYNSCLVIRQSGIDSS